MTPHSIRPQFTLVRSLMFAWLVLCFFSDLVSAQKFKQLPPPGIEVEQSKIQGLRTRVNELRTKLNAASNQSSDAHAWRADVAVLIRAVDLAIKQNLFYKKSEPEAAVKLLNEAERRLLAAVSGKRGLELLGLSPTKMDEPQLLVGGFVSVLDDSVQPYGLVIPPGFQSMDQSPRRLDVWLHGRGDTKTEIPFLTERMSKIGQYAPADTIVLHPFGRHCNAFKFAGEKDVYEALEHVRTLTPIDGNRISIRGFSMGGAGCWHLAVHDPTRWFAANPGAGFVDTIVYQGWQGNLPFPMTETRKKLLLWYDVLPWTANLKNTKTIAYSGEVDKQKQAADRVYQQSRKLGLQWPYVVGAKMGHKIDPASRSEIEAQLLVWASEPSESPRKEIDFVTYNVRYGRAAWVEVTGLKKQFTPGHVKATVTDNDKLKIETDGITHLSLNFAESSWPNETNEVGLDIDGERFLVEDANSQLPGLQCDLVLDEEWAQLIGDDEAIRKRPGLQGPIDDAFCDRFLFVLPSRPAKHGVIQRWLDREVAYAMERWSRLMRGNVRTVLDSELTADQIAANHLICFGDFSGNRFLVKVAGQLPIQWDRDKVTVGDKGFPSTTHAPVFCCPNPQNPDRYIVVNSGMTFREFSNVSNSRQIAMLPDWAVLDVSAKDDSIFPGEVVAEGFFDEDWKLK